MGLEEKASDTMTALAVCLKDAEGKDRPYHGEIECPACRGRLIYLAKTSARGTIWGTCQTPNCLSWMV